MYVVNLLLLQDLEKSFMTVKPLNAENHVTSTNVYQHDSGTEPSSAFIPPSAVTSDGSNPLSVITEAFAVCGDAPQDDVPIILPNDRLYPGLHSPPGYYGDSPMWFTVKLRLYIRQSVLRDRKNVKPTVSVLAMTVLLAGIA